ncbi:MAG TPA: universal stress protein [Actinomycetota bacterium]|nr:universal stress protein [Actinomycetota bacterium]
MLHVIEIMPIRGGVQVERDGDHAAMEATRRYARELELVGVPVKVEVVRTLAGRVARSIMESAQDHKAGVIVMGSRGRGER